MQKRAPERTFVFVYADKKTVEIMNQNYIRTIVYDQKTGEEKLAKISFYPSLVPASEKEIWEIAHFEFPLLDKESLRIEKPCLGGVEIIPDSPEPRPKRDFLPLTIFHCERPKTFAELLRKVEQAFPDVSFEDLEPSFGIVSLEVRLK